MPWRPDIPATEPATFEIIDGQGTGTTFPVQFNPASLDYSISNEFDDRNGNNGARQFVKKSSGKLTMALIFDTTTTGGDVRDVTANVAGLLEPSPDGKKKFAPKVEFGWGTYRFKGIIEQFKETIDFFSAGGVPLRSSINLTIASQQVEFQSNREPSPPVDRAERDDPVSTAPGAAPADVANKLGDPRAARDIANGSGADSLRFGGGAPLSVGGGVTLAAAASFSAGASAGIGIGGGLGTAAGAGAGTGVGGAAGIGVGASAGIGGSIGVGSAGIVATAGAGFAGLRVSPPSATVSLGDARATLLPAPAPIGTASFGPGGRARVQGGGSFSADVGAHAVLSGRIGFGD